GRLPAGVVLQERPERRLQLTPVLPVVGIERSEERVREGAQRVGLRHGQQEAIRPKVLEACGAPALQSAHPQRVAGLAQAARDLRRGHGATGTEAQLASKTTGQGLAQALDVPAGL